MGNSGFRFEDDGDIAEINVVPLVDIILVVLIIFMVTAPMIMKPSLNVNLPKAASGDKTKPSLLNISISADGKVNLNGVISTLDQVGKKAAEELAKDPEVQAVIAADKDLPHGKVIEVIDTIKTAGVKKFAISTDKK